MQLQCNRVLLGVEVPYHQRQSKGDNQTKLQNLTNKMHVHGRNIHKNFFKSIISEFLIEAFDFDLFFILLFLATYCLIKSIKYVIALEAHQIRFFSDKTLL